MSVQQFLVYKIDKYEFAIEISKIEQIISPSEIFQVPFVPAFVEGVIDCRGTICTVINLREKLNFPKHEIDEDSKLIITSANGQYMGILADSASRIIKIETDEIKSVKKVDGIDSKYIKNAMKIDKTTLIDFNFDNINK